ncbi:MAG: NAD(P)/FAD-dependent oxidoreductase [Lachnospiraceae bacterium]|nr:NAD(P)/FAD-dependent oxidoreductase [Lachnospiraceae bacterium]
MYDVIVIGAGVTGSAIARELSKYERNVAVIEKASDICEGTSKANSGIVHAGYDAVPGTLKAKLNVAGNEKMESLSKELDFPFRRNGSLVLMFEEEDRPALEALYERGLTNGVKDLRILTPEEVRKIEPGVTKQVAGALYAPTGGIVCPFGLNIALAENACDNGVSFFLDTEVLGIEKKRDEQGTYYRICTGSRKNGETIFESRVVINAAGVYADYIHNMVSEKKMTITPRKGEYCLLDKTEGKLIKSTVFQLPSKMGKGILVTPTVHGNLLVGPTAQDIDDKEGVNTTALGLETVMSKASRSVETLSGKKIITSFAGLRPHEDGGDFIIEEVTDASGFIDAAGIDSPGLSCVPVIGEYVADIVNKISPAPRKKNFIATRKGVPSMAEATERERQALIAENPAFGQVICRCEMVTEGEILNAIHRTLGATTLDGIKRRTRAGMGRCQAGFCAPKTVEILARELGVDMEQITKAGGNSGFLDGTNKEVQS